LSAAIHRRILTPTVPHRQIFPTGIEAPRSDLRQRPTITITTTTINITIITVRDLNPMTAVLPPTLLRWQL
jgi:hypothetical protein